MRSYGNQLQINLRIFLFALLTLVTATSCVGFEDDVRAIDVIDVSDHPPALKKWNTHGEENHASAQYNLGVMYLTGNGVPQDYKNAIKWLERSAEKQNTLAQILLGSLYLNGQVVIQDHDKGIQFFTLAAEQGDEEAQFLLGSYNNAVRRDHISAHMWWNLAASQGHKEAGLDRDQLQSKMTLTQIEVAQQLARECAEKNYVDCRQQPSAEELQLLETNGDLISIEETGDTEQLRDEAEFMAKLPTEKTQRSLSSLEDAYKLAIMQKIRRNWIRPSGSEKILNCEVRVLQGPGGVILDVTFANCPGGDNAYRASIENAVYKAEPLPKPGDPAIFARELDLNFKPK